LAIDVEITAARINKLPKTTIAGKDAYVRAIARPVLGL